MENQPIEPWHKKWYVTALWVLIVTIIFPPFIALYFLFRVWWKQERKGFLFRTFQMIASALLVGVGIVIAALRYSDTPSNTQQPVVATQDNQNDAAQTSKPTGETQPPFQPQRKIDAYTLNATAKEQRDGVLRVEGNTNLPEGSKLDVGVSRQITYKDGMFDDTNDMVDMLLGAKLGVAVSKDGVFTANITLDEDKWAKNIDLVTKFKNEVMIAIDFDNIRTPHQPANVVAELGDGGVNLKGELVKELKDPIDPSKVMSKSMRYETQFAYPPKALEQRFALGEVMAYVRKKDGKTLVQYFQEKLLMGAADIGWKVEKNPKGAGYLVGYIFQSGGFSAVPIWLVIDHNIYWVNGKAHSFTDELPQAEGISAGDAYDLFTK